MLRLLSDENFHGDIVRGLRRRFSELDLVRVQDAGLSGIDDPALLSWASKENRILLTHDDASARSGEISKGIECCRSLHR